MVRIDIPRIVPDLAQPGVVWYSPQKGRVRKWVTEKNLAQNRKLTVDYEVFLRSPSTYYYVNKWGLLLTKPGQPVWDPVWVPADIMRLMHGLTKNAFIQARTVYAERVQRAMKKRAIAGFNPLRRELGE